MSGYKEASFSKRLDNQAAAKKALLERFRNKPGLDDPRVQARQAEMKAVAEARAVRQEERRIAKEAEMARLAAEEAARQVELARVAAQEAAHKREEEQRLLALKAEQKAARDARYAARKIRTGRKAR